MSGKNSRKTSAAIVELALEFGLLMLAVLIASRIRFHHDAETYAEFISQMGLLKALIVALFITLAKECFGLYQVHVRYRHGDFLLRQTLAFAFGGIGLLRRGGRALTGTILGVVALVLGIPTG